MEQKGFPYEIYTKFNLDKVLERIKRREEWQINGCLFNFLKVALLSLTFIYLISDVKTQKVMKKATEKNPEKPPFY